MIANTDAFAALKSEWDALTGTSPFASHQWFAHAWQVWFKGRGAQLQVIKITDGTEDFGFLPLVVDRAPLRGLRAQQLRLLLPLGHSTPVRLPIDWTRLKRRPDLLARLRETIEAMRWDELSFEGLDHEDAHFLKDWLGAFSFSQETNPLEQEVASCPIIRLPESWDEFLRTCSYNKRKEISRNQRRLAARGHLEFELVANHEDITTRLKESIALAQVRGQKSGFGSGFDHAPFVAFHLAAAKELAASDQARLFILKLDGKVIASLYLFKEGETYHAYQGGFDHQYARFGPGTLLDALTMRYGIEHDQIRFFDFGYGEQPYKMRFPHELRTVTTLNLKRSLWLRKAKALKRSVTKPALSASTAPSSEQHAGNIDRGKKTLILSIGHVAGVALGMLTPMVLSRNFAIDDFGIYRQFLVIAWFIGLTAQFGMDSGLFYFVRRQPEKSAVFSLNTALFNGTMGLIIGTLLIAFADHIASFLEAPQLAREMPYAAAYFLFVLPAQHLPFYLLVKNKIKEATGLAVVNAAANATASIVGCLIFGSVRAVIIGLTIWGLVKVLWMLYLHGKDDIRAYLRNWKPDFQLLKQQLKFGAPIGMATLVMVAAKLDRFLVSAFFGLRAFTGYSVGCFDLPVLPQIFDSMSGLMVTDMVNKGEGGEIDEEKRERVLSIWLSTVTQILTLLVPAVIFSVAFADTIIVAFFSETYRSSADFFQIYVLSFFLLYLDPDHVFQGLARTKLSFKINVFGAIVSLSAMFIGMKLYGVMGILLGRVAGEFIATSTRFLVLGHTLKANTLRLIPWRTAILLFFAAVLAGKTTSLAVAQIGAMPSFVRLVACAVVFGVCYGFFGVLFGALKISTVIALVRKRNANI